MRGPLVEHLSDRQAATDLTEPQIELAVTYWRAYPEEIDAAIEENRRPASDVIGLFPFIRYHEIAPHKSK